MTQIRVNTPEVFTDSLGGGSQTDTSRNIQLQGMAVGNLPVDGHMSLHSEPDIDTIMPLPGAAPYYAHAQLQNVVSSTGGYTGGHWGERMSEDSGSIEEEEDGDRNPLMSRQSSDFMTVEHPLGDIFGDDLTAKALETCKKTVLKPYLTFLKVIGWRKIRSSNFDLEPPLWQTTVNLAWPTIVCLLIIASCVTQILTCFRRDTIPVNGVQATTLLNGSNDTSYHNFYDIKCERHILTTFIIPDILLCAAFIYGLYIFRWVQTEHLSTLTELVFLGHITRHGRYSHKRLTCTLQLLICLGFVWILYSLCASIFRVYSLKLLVEDTRIEWIPRYDDDKGSNLIIRWFLIVISLIGFIILDFAYTAVVINYSIQCQLLIYLFHSICDRMKAKEWEIDQTIWRIKNARDFLSHLNSHLARAMSLLLFIFLTSSIQAFYGLQQIHKGDNIKIVGIGGLLAAIQWTSILVLPLIQGARVTRACTKLKKTGHDVRSRPYNYQDTPQLDLDSVVIFTSGLNMSAKLVSIPIYPSFVVGALFFVGVILFLVFQYDRYSWQPWL